DRAVHQDGGDRLRGVDGDVPAPRTRDGDVDAALPKDRLDGVEMRGRRDQDDAVVGAEPDAGEARHRVDDDALVLVELDDVRARRELVRAPAPGRLTVGR